MTYVADLHLHSAYAYATSSALTLDNLSHWARLKGVDLLATADFTHPAWFRELAANLVEESAGLYAYGGVHFVLGTEVSCVFRQGGRHRRVHLLVFAPGLAAAARLNQALARHGNLESDGRPTLTLSVRDLTALALETSPDCIVMPAHAWTPWYGVYGSKSGFDHLSEAFGDLYSHIYAVETGLSSDPEMNWAIPELSDKTIVSFSDAHSLPKLAREVTAFDGELSYSGLADALRCNRVAYSVEFHPAEGKYHYDGHRKCGVCQHPAVTQREGSRCPVCRRPLTLGVLNRTRLLSSVEPPKAFALPEANEKANEGLLPDGMVASPEGRPPFIRLIPLQEIIAGVLRQGPNTKRVQDAFRRIVAELGSELIALLWAGAADLERAAGPELAQAILRARRGDVHVEPGYDGVYGKVALYPPDRADRTPSTAPLF